MEKRVLLAMVLSISVLLGYNYLVTKVYHLEKPGLVIKETLLPQNSPASVVPEIKPETKAASSISLEHKMLENENLKLVFTNLGGNLEEVYLKDFQRKFFETGIFHLQELKGLPFELASRQNNRLIYVYADALKRISKIYTISNNTIELELKIENISSAPQNLNLNLDYFSLDLQTEDPDFQKDKSFLELAISLPDKILRKNVTRINPKGLLLQQNKFNWLGLRDRYFCSIFKPESIASNFYTQLTANKVLTIGMPIQFLNLAPKAQAQFKAKLFVGPLNTAVLTSADKDFSQMVHFGTFDAISKLLLSLLRWLHNFLPNWGFCIIGLSLVLFFLLYPLTLKSLKSMKAMQCLQPEMEKLRKEYKDQPQKLNKEIMELYKKQRVNPFGGCLPMVLQIPIFFALYQALLRSLELRGAKFFWIKDLSQPDRLFILPYNIPILGNEFNILPILMAIVMFLQQKLTSKTTPSSNPEQQQMMMILFPILFGFMFYRLSSGLVLYWFVYSGLSLIFQWKQLAPTPKMPHS